MAQRKNPGIPVFTRELNEVVVTATRETKESWSNVAVPVTVISQKPSNRPLLLRLDIIQEQAGLFITQWLWRRCYECRNLIMH